MWFSSTQPQLEIAAEVCRDFRDAGPRFAAAGVVDSDTYLEHWTGDATLFEVAIPNKGAWLHALFVPDDGERPFRAGWSTNGLILDGPPHFDMPASVEAQRSSQATITWMLEQVIAGPPAWRRPKAPRAAR